MAIIDFVLLTVNGVKTPMMTIVRSGDREDVVGNQVVEEGENPADRVEDRLEDGAKEVAYRVHDWELLG